MVEREKWMVDGEWWKEIRIMKKMIKSMKSKLSSIHHPPSTILLPLFTLLLLPLLLSCSDTSNKFHLEGNFKNINQGEFYIYDLHGGRKDTIGLRDGQFTYNIEMRDTAILMLLFPNFSELPIIATPGGKVKMEGDVSHLKETKITGTEANEQLTAFRFQTNDMMPPEVQQKAEEFINEHPESPASHYLLRKYFILAYDADYEKINELSSKILEAHSKNVPIIQFHNRLKAVKELKTEGKLPSFSAVDTKGDTITNSHLNGKANVIMVWASWDYDSQNGMRLLHNLQKDHPKDIKVISICMDASPYEGKDFLKRDSITWPNICDGLIWNSPIAAELGLTYMPDDIVIDHEGNIVGRHLINVMLKKKIDSLLE